MAARRALRSLVAGFVAALAAASVAAQSPSPGSARTQLATKLRVELERLAAAAPGVVGLGVVDLTNGERWGLNAT